ncbi:MAG: cellulase [Armatimonadetes bacterium]|nr:cellulase [Armatimonadota bacterium]
MSKRMTFPLLIAGLGLGLLHAAAQTPTVITVDADANRHPISPLIYGVAFASTDQLRALNSPLNRSGGNATTRYNWQANASNHAADWFFESIPEQDPTPGGSVDSFIAATRAAGAQPMVTIPTIGWVAKLGPNRAMLPSFSVAKYGPQQKTDPYHSDAGNGVKSDGQTDITGNDPHDAHIPSTPAFQRGWVRHLTAKWGRAARGGVRYYLMDNETSLWHSTHRDVHPQGQTMHEELDDVLAYGTMVKSVNPAAQVVAPEEWGWPGYFSSGADEQYAAAHHYQGHPDKDAHGGMDYLPWLLTQIHQHDQKTGRRLLDVFTVHIYPQGGDGGDDVSPRIQALRNRSTRSLWDPNYKDESWINDKIMLIPRLKEWVRTYYPGTKIGITEYNWGAERNMGGATAQADILGIFGREGLDLATRWTTPDSNTPTFKAMQMYRNYDGHHSTFGDVSVSDAAPDPDSLASFAAVRSADHALTVMVINKAPDAAAPVALALSHFTPGATAQAWQLTSANAITRLPDVPVTGGRLAATLPAQSVTLFVVSGGR